MKTNCYKVSSTFSDTPDLFATSGTSAVRAAMKQGCPVNIYWLDDNGESYLTANWEYDQGTIILDHKYWHS